MSWSQTRGAALFLIWLGIAVPAGAQRASENAVAEASDAFGTSVGREEIGLYTAMSARGFSPVQAGNLRIDGLYFDQIQYANPVSRIVRGSTVHVGLTAQGFPFPAPTGVVDFHLRTPGDELAGGALLGIASYDQAYAEIDGQAPLIPDVLSVGGGVGYARNSYYNFGELTHEWTAGAIARWLPTSVLTITPFWSMKQFINYEERPFIFLGDSGLPEYRTVDLMAQPWAHYGEEYRNFGTTARLVLGEDWSLDAGAFRSELQSRLNYLPFLFDVGSTGAGNYFVSASPARLTRSTSGELRLSRRFAGQTMRHTLYASIKARQRSAEAGGAHNIFVGPGTTQVVPLIQKPDFTLTPTTLVEATQYTPGIAYEGVWRDVGQLSVGLQKTNYERTIKVPGGEPVSGSSSPWLHNVGGALYLTKKFVVYASATRGFEEIGTAPLNAANRDEAVPAQKTEQVDAGLRYQLLPRLQLVAGVFRIKKPYFDLDQLNLYRRIGSTSNTGAEISLTGELTDRFTAVVGVILIDPKVEFDAGAGGPGSQTAIGPIPGLVRANFQYRVAEVPGLILDAKLEYTSERDARADLIRLPSTTTFDAGFRYGTTLLGRAATVRLKASNLTNEYGLTPEASGRVVALDSRRFDLSLALDL